MLFTGISVRTARALALGAVLCIGASAVRADEVSDFYRGKTINMVIGYATGGGYDIAARLLAPYMSKYLPGNPTIVPQNRPGAASMVAANYLYSVAPKDGLSFGTVSRAAPLQPLLAPDKTKFDARKFGWIGSINGDTLLCVAWHTTKFAKWQDMVSQQFLIGAGGAGGDTDVTARALNKMIDTKIKQIGPYPGNAEVDLAMERGEIDGKCGYSWSSLRAQHPDWLKDKKINILIQTALVSHPDLKQVPVMGDLISQTNKPLLNLLVGTQMMARPFLTPPNVPAGRLQALRDAFDKTMLDPAFIAQAERQAIDVEPVKGQEIDALIAELYKSPKEVITEASAILGE